MTREVNTSAVRTTLLIGGHWRRPTGNLDLVVPDPADPQQVVGYAANASASDVDDAVAAAAAAQPGWASLPIDARAQCLRTAADRLDADLGARITLLTRETGKVRPEATLEMARLEARIRDTASLASALDDLNLGPPPRRSVITYAPIGVVALIVPWNWPLSILGAKLPQALLAGNTVVVKPSPSAPLATMQTLALLASAFPPGVVNAVTGTTDVTGVALVRHPGLRKIDFTGGTENGRAVMAAAAPNLTRLTLELGGNDPALIMQDAEVTVESMTRLSKAAFTTSGQVCMAVKRLYVHATRHDDVMQALADVLAKTLIGPASNVEATMGPVHNERQQRLVRQLVEQARTQGATTHEYGHILDQDSPHRGWFLQPTLVTNIRQDSPLVTCEQFGPALPVLTFTSDDDAVNLANDSPYGLCSSIWTTDIEHGLTLARRLHAGTTYINHHGPAAQDDRTPFGGVKHSGIGRQLGPHGIREFTDPHVLTIFDMG